MGAAVNHEGESSPLLPTEAAGEKVPPAPAPEAAKYCADGVPVVMGEPVGAHSVGGVPRESWNSGILSCLGRNDEFCSSDLEVCTCPFSTSDRIICYSRLKLRRFAFVDLGDEYVLVLLRSSSILAKWSDYLGCLSDCGNEGPIWCAIGTFFDLLVEF